MAALAPRQPLLDDEAHGRGSEIFVFLTSETLTGDELATLAAGLKPAPSTRRI